MSFISDNPELLLAIAAVLIILYFASQYERFSGPAVIMLHHTTWCGACQRMRPVWDEVKASVGWSSLVVFTENDEDKNPTPGITGYPTIMKHRGWSNSVYEGPIDAASIRAWVLA